MATLRANAWAGSSRIVWLLMVLLALVALLGLVGAAPNTRVAASGDDEALISCSLPDVRVERSRSLAATLLPRPWRTSPSPACIARC